MTDDIAKKVREAIIAELRSGIRTEEEIESDMKPYDVDHDYEYGQQAGYEMAIDIVNKIFKDFGYEVESEIDYYANDWIGII